MKEPSNKDNILRITNQSRRKGGMEYWLKHEGMHLRIIVSPRENPVDAGDWQVEARAGRTGNDTFSIAEWGPTRAAALRAVGQSWESSAVHHALVAFDWEAVAKALNEVKAL